MKKLLLIVIVILLLLTGCATKAPVLPESEAEQPVQTEQPPVEEQPAEPPEASPEEPPELTVPPVDYTAFCGHYSDTETVEGPCYTVSILGVDNETGEIELSISYVGVNSSPVYTTDPIRAAIESDHTVAFDWKDSWNNQGVGALILNPGDPSSVQLMMTVTEEAEFNRATLSTREQYKTLMRRVLPEIPENIDEETARILERVYAMDFSELELGADKALLLDFLTVALTDETSLNDWNKLGNDWDAIYRFYDIKNTIITFLEELEQDSDLKALFWQMEQWKIYQEVGMRYSVSGVDTGGQEWAAYVIPGIGVDMEAYVTPSRKNLQTLSETGENSELVSEEIRKEFVTFALRECWYGREVAGKYGTTQWIWHVSEEGDVLLEARHYPGGEVMEHHKRPYNIIYLKKSEGAVYLLNYVDQSNDLPDV